MRQISFRMLILGAIATLAAMRPASAATPEEIEASIQRGLAWLASMQRPDGSWDQWGCERVALTGLAVTKLEDRARELGFEDPTDPNYEYGEAVRMGLEFIVAHRIPVDITAEPQADSDGDGVGYMFDDCGAHPNYNTGIAMMALGASQRPDLYGDLLRDAMDWMAFAQENAGCEPHRGGWAYSPNWCSWADNSNSGYSSLGLGFAAAVPPRGFGLTVLPWVLSELSIWIGAVQNADGGSAYIAGDGWSNILRTGNLLYEMALVGDTLQTARVQRAVDYVEANWTMAGCEGWIDNPQGAFTLMKGLEAFDIKLLDLDGDGVPEFDWFDAVSTHLVVTQQPDGSWPAGCWGAEVLTTSWALLTLERVVAPPQARVFLDIKPGSCPNPLNLKSRGVLPVAVLGTEEFDASMIDPASIRLTREGVVDEDGEPVLVPPLRWALEDVATPFEGELCACHGAGPDGFMDLTLKFDTVAVVQMLRLAEVAGTDSPLMVVGVLTQPSGVAFRGEDCVRVHRQ